MGNMVHENVEKVRTAKGVTKTYISKKLGLTLQGYSHLVSGNVRMDVERLKIIAYALGVKPGVFYDDWLTESVVEEINNVGITKNENVLVFPKRN